VNKRKQIAIFISGAGSNARNIIQHFKGNDVGRVAILLSNKPENGAEQIAQENNIQLISFTKTELNESDVIIDTLKEYHVDLIVLAGFLLKIPETLVKAFPNQIINVHPALLPKFGGKGMYGKHVHEAVFEAKETETGITIHYVNEHYDEGNVIAQFKCSIDDNVTPETIEQNVRELEQNYFAQTIEKLIKNEL